MSIAMEVLSLRRDRLGSVELLLAALEWQKAAQDTRSLMRGQAVIEAVDTVLLKVAVHASEAQGMLQEGGYPAKPTRRTERLKKRLGSSRRARSERQLQFATFYN
jgi:hypothetical protein